MDWTTLTHARLRAAQGDVSGAQRITRAVLARDPGDERALRLLAELRGRVEVRPSPEARDPQPEERVEGDPAAERALSATGPGDARRAARARLARVLARIERRGESPAVLFRRDRG